MNSFDSMIESDQNISEIPDADHNCTAIDRTTGELCGETETLKIIDQFQKLYEARIDNVDRELENEFDQICMKLEISKEWIRNLREQNVMLVQVVEDLEHAACNRVKLLEQKLKHSSVLVSENMANSMHTEKTINTLSNRVSNLKRDEEYMQQRIEFLQSDIRGLLELIRRAVKEKHWSLKDIKFLEIQPSDIPVPNNCTCDEEEINHKEVQSLNLQIKDLQESERKMIAYQKDLEVKLTHLNSELQSKEDIIKRYVSQFKNFNNDIRKHAEFINQNETNSFVTNDEESFDIMLVADVVENLFTKKNLEAKSLQERLHNMETNLEIVSRDSNINLNSLKIQLHEKCKRLEEIEQEMVNLQKESVKKQDVLKAEVMEKNEIVLSLQKQITILQEQCCYAHMQTQFNKDVLKEMRKELKWAIAKETHGAQNHSTDIKTCPEDQIVLYLNKVKSLMEQEKEDLSKLQMELKKTVKKLCFEKNVEPHITNNECNEDNIKSKLDKHIEYIDKIYSRKEESLAIINSLLQMTNNNRFCLESLNLSPCIDICQQAKVIDIVKAYAIEAQVSVKDIKDEMNVMVSSFKCRHQKYVDLNKEVTNVQNQLIRSLEKIAEVINRLQLGEEERIRQNERLTCGKIKLKDIKNEVNRAQCRLSIPSAEMQSSAQENILSGYAEMSVSNDLLCSVIDEIEKTSCSLQIFQSQGYSLSTDLEMLKNQFCEADLSIKKLQEKIEEALSEHDMIEHMLLQKEQKLQKLEGEVDVINIKIQSVLGTFSSSKEQILNEILQIQQNVYKLRKEHDELKYKMTQKSLYTECDKRTCLWKSRVTDLQDQVKILQQQVKCKAEESNFLRNSLGTVEEELHVAQAKADSYRRSHFIDNMKLKKKIIELENTLKFRKEIECTLHRQLSNSKVELKMPKELFSACHVEHNMEDAFPRFCCNQFRHDTVTPPQLIKTLQNTIRSTKSGLQELKAEFKKLICEDSANFSSSARSFIDLMDKLQKYEDELDNCFQEIEKLKSALSSKDKLIENKDEIINIQKDSIVMMQAELKNLHQKHQEKIDGQDHIISQYEKEKKELLVQNELQIQTIGHLQNAVVEAKRCIDQMGHRTESNRIASSLLLKEKTEAIRLLTIYAEETQSQYNECFAEATKQDKLLELQRDAINELQQKITCLEYDNQLAMIIIHTTYYSVLKTIQEQVETRVYDIQALKDKMETLTQSKFYLENKYLNVRKLWKEAEEKIQELRKDVLKPEHKPKFCVDAGCQCKTEVKDCATQNILDSNSLKCNNSKSKNLSYEYDLQSEIEVLTRENEDIKRQLQKYKLDFDIIDKELKIERKNDTYTQQLSFKLQKLKDTECSLQYENDQLKCDLKKQTQNTEHLLEKFTEENSTKLKKMLQKLEDKQVQINGLCNQITNNETVMKEQAEIIEELEKKLDVKNQEMKGYLVELDDAEEEMSTLHERIKSLKTMLKEKSDEMAKLQADYEVLKNENCILKMDNTSFEDRTKEDFCHLQNTLKDVQRQLCFTENNYCRVAEDFEKTQEQLIKMTKREADLQECLTNVEIHYCSKLANTEKEKAKLGDYLDKLRDQLEDMQRNYSLKCEKYCELQDICKSYAKKIELLQQQVENEAAKVKKIEESTRCITQQLHECREQNSILVKEKAVAEQNNCDIISELEETHKSLLELERECNLKDKSLACISAELTETAISRSELRNQSQYVVSCIRIWLEEQRKYVHKLSSKLKSQQQEVLQLGFEKKNLLDEIKKLRRINHSLIQRIKRIHKHGSKNVRNVCVGCQILPQNVDIRLPINTKYLPSQKKLNLMKTARRISVYGNAWWFPRMKYLVNELRKSNVESSENYFTRVNTDIRIEENQDCGYQSTTSK